MFPKKNKVNFPVSGDQMWENLNNYKQKQGLSLDTKSSNPEPSFMEDLRSNKAAIFMAIAGINALMAVWFSKCESDYQSERQYIKSYLAELKTAKEANEEENRYIYGDNSDISATGLLDPEPIDSEEQKTAQLVKKD